MSTRSCAPRHNVALDAAFAGFFVAVDTWVTLAGASLRPAHPGKLAWAMLALQGVADASLVAKRRAPMLIIPNLTGIPLLISALILGAGEVAPGHAGNLWAPYGIC